MRRAVFPLAVVLLSLGTAGAQIVGDWQGTLHPDGASLRVVLHIAAAPDGAYTATMDSPDQGAAGIPVDSVVFKDSAVNFTVSAANGSYEGKLGANGSSIEGQWTQGSSLPLNLTRFTPPKPAAPSPIDGEWNGVLGAGGEQLHLILHIANTSAGLTATLDSLDQGAKGLGITKISRDGDSLKFTMDLIGAAFEGNIKSDRRQIDGTWMQGGNSLPLTLTATPSR